jgi:hypothetical protein
MVGLSYVKTHMVQVTSLVQYTHTEDNYAALLIPFRYERTGLFIDQLLTKNVTAWVIFS